MLYYKWPFDFEYLWWHFMPGTTIAVKWPVGEVRIRQEPSGLWDYIRSADPNDHYRPWLEYNVGKQHWDWDWRHGQKAANNGAGTCGYDTLIIKIRKKKSKWATAAALIWA